jgi:hypothetical protein
MQKSSYQSPYKSVIPKAPKEFSLSNKDCTPSHKPTHHLCHNLQSKKTRKKQKHIRSKSFSAVESPRHQ